MNLEKRVALKTLDWRGPLQGQSELLGGGCGAHGGDDDDGVTLHQGVANCLSWSSLQ